MSRDHAVSDCDRPLISIKRSEKFNLQMSSNKEFSGFIVHFLHQTFITPLGTRVNIFYFWNTDSLYDWLDDDLYLLAAVLHVLLLPVVVREERLARLGQQEEHHEPCGQQTAADRRTLLETFQSVRIQGVRGHKGVCFKATFKGLEVFETLKTLRYFLGLFEAGKTYSLNITPIIEGTPCICLSLYSHHITPSGTVSLITTKAVTRAMVSRI